MATRTLFLSCFHSGGSETSHHLALRSRYPSMPRRPRAAATVEVGDDGAGGSGADLEAATGAAVAAAEEEKV